MILSIYIHEAMLRARYKVLSDNTYFGEIPAVAGVWANERALDKCREVLQEVLEEWLLLKFATTTQFPAWAGSVCR